MAPGGQRAPGHAGQCRVARLGEGMRARQKTVIVSTPFPVGPAPLAAERMSHRLSPTRRIVRNHISGRGRRDVVDL
jgi:hypothetical protein